MHCTRSTNILKNPGGQPRRLLRYGRFAAAAVVIASTFAAIVHAIFRRHLQSISRKRDSDSFKILLIAQAFERAGDHAKNLAEEVVHLVRGHTFRHSSRARLRSE